MSSASSEPRLILTQDGIADADLRDLYNLWIKTHQNSIGPLDMDLLDFPNLLPWCIKFLLKEGQGVDEAVVTYVGNQLTTILERDDTGMRLSEIDRYPLGQQLIRYCGETKSAVVVGPAAIPLEGKEFLTFEYICLPLFEDATSLSGFLFTSHRSDS